MVAHIMPTTMLLLQLRFGTMEGPDRDAILSELRWRADDKPSTDLMDAIDFFAGVSQPKEVSDAVKSRLDELRLKIQAGSEPFLPDHRITGSHGGAGGPANFS